MAKKIKLNGPVIGDGSAWLYNWLGMPYISASKVSKELDEARGDDVELYINSGGGSVFAGSEVYTALKEYTGKVTAKITGVAASAASFLAMAADEIKMSPTSQMMIHNASTWTDGDKHNHSSNTDMLHGTDIAITNAYRLKTGRSQDELLDLMNKTTWMNAQLAVELGFADGILFDEDNALLDISNNVSGGEIPPDVESKFRDLAIAALLKGDAQNISSGNKNPFDGLDMAAILPHAEDLSRVTNNIEENHTDQQQKQKIEEDPIVKTVDELKQQYPDLVNQIENAAKEQGAQAERARIKGIEEIGNTISPELVNKAKYEQPMNAQELAFEALKNDAANGRRFLNDTTADTKDSGVDGIDANPQDPVKNEKNQTEVANVVNAMAEFLNKGVK